MQKIISNYTIAFKNAAIFFTALIFIFSACKEDKGTIGQGIQPEDEFLNTDYLEAVISARSAPHDSLITSNMSVNMLGYLNDNVFGKTKAGIYTQFRLSDFAANFGNNVVVDSLVLTLVYAGYYGDTLNSFRVNVYELTEDLEKSKKYYTLSSLSHNGISLTETPNLYISPRPTVKHDTALSSYCLNIKLKKDFAANKFVSQSGTGTYDNHEAFLNYFKGLLIEADDATGNGCMISLNMAHLSSKLTMYYSNSDTNNLKYSFNLNDSTVHFGAVTHDYTAAEANFKAQVLNGDSSSAKDILYAQAGAGVKVVLHFPDLKEKFKDKKVIIHRASLVISHKYDALANTNYPPPSSLFLSYTDPVTGNEYFLPDYSSLAVLRNDYFGGKYNQTSKEYIFSITQYIQLLADDRWGDYQLNLTVGSNVTHFSRLMMYGTDTNLAERLKLKINYTVIEK